MPCAAGRSCSRTPVTTACTGSTPVPASPWRSPRPARGASAASSCTTGTSTPCARTTPATRSRPTSWCGSTSTATTPTVGWCSPPAPTSSRARRSPPTAGRSPGSPGTTRACRGTPRCCCGPSSPRRAPARRVVVAGGADVSAVQPAFGPDGALWFLSDESGFWTVHRDTGSGPVALHHDRADHAAPQWVLGAVDLAVLDADRALVRWWDTAVARLGVLDARTGVVEPLDVEGVTFDQLQAVDGEVALRRGLPDRLPEVVRGPLGGPLRVLARAGTIDLDPGRHLPGRGVVVDRHRRPHRARPAAPATVGRHRGSRGRAAAPDRHGARRPHRPHRGVVHHGDPVLDHPRLRGAARELLRQHRLRPRLPRAAARPLGPARHRRLRHRRDVPGARGSRRRHPARHPRRQRRRVLPCCAP